jgi:hypothetical protein
MPDPPNMQSPGGGQADVELQAIQSILAAFANLDPEASKRVIGYVLERLKVSTQLLDQQTTTPPLPPLVNPRQSEAPSVTDIRALKEQKNPRSAIEMTALVAYYLARLAPAGERKEEITSKDVNKYFNQAVYPLPGRPRKTLFDTKNAGYLDAGPSRGSYKLNPVGHNLVVHTLPATGQINSAQRARGPRRRAKKRPRSTVSKRRRT